MVQAARSEKPDVGTRAPSVPKVKLPTGGGAVRLLTLRGKDADSRIADPEDPKRILSWLICKTRDGRDHGILHRQRGGGYGAGAAKGE